MPTLTVNENEAYTAFIPTTSDDENNNLSFSIANAPSWSTFNTVTGELSGTPSYTDGGSYPDIVITVTDDGEPNQSTSLAPFTITVIDIDRNIIVTDLSYATENNGEWTTEAQTINEAEELNFSAAAYDPDGNDLVYSWKSNGTEVSTEATYDFSTTFASAGNYIIALSIKDNFGFTKKSTEQKSKSRRTKEKKSKDVVSYVWSISVTNINTAPVITSFLPTELEINITDSNDEVKFKINAEDAQDDALIYKWFVDGIEQDSIEFTFTNNFPSGNYEVKGLVSDGVLADSTVWTVKNTSSIDNNLPVVTELKQNYPNPFNPATTISYSLAEEGEVRVVIYNSAGNIVADLVNKKQARGNYNVKWNGSNLTSGLYFIRMKAGNYHKNIKAMLVK